MAHIKMHSFSNILHMDMDIEVILPEVHDTAKMQDLPVMYLLHGAHGNQTAWQRRSRIETYALEKGIAVVMPATHYGFYSNQARGGFRYFDYITEELPKICQSYFPISSKREKNIIAGLSMGGYGALKIGLRCSSNYAYVIALSAGCNRYSLLSKNAQTIKTVDELLLRRDELTPEQFDKTMQFFVNFGSLDEYNTSETDNLHVISQNIANNIDILPKIFMSCGTDDELATEVNRDLHKHFTKLNIPHFYDEPQGGKHDWDFWDTHIKRGLDWLPDFK